MISTKLTGAIDIGGTKLLVGLIDQAGELLARTRTETLPEQGAEQVIARSVHALHELLQEMNA